MKSLSRLVRGSVLFAFSAAVALLGAGCQASPEDFCNKMCDCSGTCTDKSLQECIDYFENYQKVAQDVGCGSEYQAALSCSANGQCTNAEYTTDCEEESAAFSACEQKVNGGS